MTASVAAAVEISLDAAVVDVFITTGRHFPIKGEAKGTERLFLVERDVSIQLWLEVLFNQSSPQVGGALSIKEEDEASRWSSLNLYRPKICPMTFQVYLKSTFPRAFSSGRNMK